MSTRLRALPVSPGAEWFGAPSRWMPTPPIEQGFRPNPLKPLNIEDPIWGGARRDFGLE